MFTLPKNNYSAYASSVQLDGNKLKLIMVNPEAAKNAHRLLEGCHSVLSNEGGAGLPYKFERKRAIIIITAKGKMTSLEEFLDEPLRNLYELKIITAEQKKEFTINNHLLASENTPLLDNIPRIA